jgi:hypothetical protein
VLHPYKIEKETSKKWMSWVLIGLSLIALVGMLLGR